MLNQNQPSVTAALERPADDLAEPQQQPGEEPSQLELQLDGSTAASDSSLPESFCIPVISTELVADDVTTNSQNFAAADLGAAREACSNQINVVDSENLISFDTSEERKHPLIRVTPEEDESEHGYPENPENYAFDVFNEDQAEGLDLVTASMLADSEDAYSELRMLIAVDNSQSCGLKAAEDLLKHGSDSNLMNLDADIDSESVSQSNFEKVGFVGGSLFEKTDGLSVGERVKVTSKEKVAETDLKEHCKKHTNSSGDGCKQNKNCLCECPGSFSKAGKCAFFSYFFLVLSLLCHFTQILTLHFELTS